MSNQTITVTPQIYQYLLNVSLRESEIMTKLREETMQLEQSMMQISPEQGQFMQLMVKAIGAKRTIEVGVFTGYSALAVANALPDDGMVIACDVSEEWTSIGQKYWEQAGVSKKIDLRIAPAAKTMQGLIENGESGKFDFAFIDADKPAYDQYYEQCLILLRPGGLIMLDNTLWSGKVADPNVDDEDTQAIRQLNQKLHGDSRIDLCIIPMSDGITLVRKR